MKYSFLILLFALFEFHKSVFVNEDPELTSPKEMKSPENLNDLKQNLSLLNTSISISSFNNSLNLSEPIETLMDNVNNNTSLIKEKMKMKKLVIHAPAPISKKYDVKETKLEEEYKKRKLEDAPLIYQKFSKYQKGLDEKLEIAKDASEHLSSLSNQIIGNFSDIKEDYFSSILSLKTILESNNVILNEINLLESIHKKSVKSQQTDHISKLNENDCLSLTDCFSCVNDEKCGWCGVEKKCVLGSKYGGLNKNCLQYAFTSCIDMFCSPSKSCEECLLDEDCYWCAPRKSCFLTEKKEIGECDTENMIVGEASLCKNIDDNLSFLNNIIESLNITKNEGNFNE